MGGCIIRGVCAVHRVVNLQLFDKHQLGTRCLPNSSHIAEAFPHFTAGKYDWAKVHSLLCTCGWGKGMEAVASQLVRGVRQTDRHTLTFPVKRLNVCQSAARVSRLSHGMRWPSAMTAVPISHDVDQRK